MDWITISQWGKDIVFILFFIGIFFLALKRGLIFKTKNASLIINKENLITVIVKALGIQRKISRIDDKIRKKEQMKYIEDKIDEITKITIRLHEDILAKNINIYSVQDHEQSKMFVSILKNIMTDTKSEMRDRMDEMLEKFPSEDNKQDDYYNIEKQFKIYQDHVTGYLISYVADQIKEHWIRNQWVRYEDVEKGFINIEHEIRTRVNEALYNGILVQLKYQKKIRTLERQLEEKTDQAKEK
jgi:hypothetical protein